MQLHAICYIYKFFFISLLHHFKMEVVKPQYATMVKLLNNLFALNFNICENIYLCSGMWFLLPINLNLASIYYYIQYIYYILVFYNYSFQFCLTLYNLEMILVPLVTLKQEFVIHKMNVPIKVAKLKDHVLQDLVHVVCVST